MSHGSAWECSKPHPTLFANICLNAVSGGCLGKVMMSYWVFRSWSPDWEHIPKLEPNL
jgi:hypothetical protein